MIGNFDVVYDASLIHPTSLNAPEIEIDKKWAEVAKHRLQQLQSGEVTPITSAEVFKKIAEKFQ